MGNIQSYDNVEDRKEIYNMLSNYLNESLREAYLLWCCGAVGTSIGKLLRPGKNSTFHPKEVYWQLMCLITMHGLNADLATQKLTEVSKKGKLL